MELRLFGDLEAWNANVVVSIRGPKQRSLLAMLALQRGDPVSADRLMDALWGDDGPGNPANALQALVAQLRRALGSEAISTSEAGYALRVDPDDVDIFRFERLVLEARRAVERGDAAAASALLSEALALVRGEPLAEFAYSGFAEGERARLDELLLLASEARAEAWLMSGRHAEVVGELEVLCRHHPLRERLWELHMLALYRAGRQADALRAYAEARALLVDELGIEPGAALRDLETRILNQDPTIEAPRRPALQGPAASTGNLRERASSFVGRESELQHLQDAVRSSRLVTVLGPGGVGKTRLAVEAASIMRDAHPHGAWLVELAAVADPDGVASAVAGALRAAEAFGPSGEAAGSTEDLILQYVSGRSLIVILDNCEHVIEAAAAIANQMVGAAPELRVIATSREPLAVPGEVLVTLAGLGSEAATELFADRARAAQPQFVVEVRNRPLVTDICNRLDGLPLAIELAAARIRALPLTALAQRLDDRFRLLTGGTRIALPRHQTLRAVVDWSYELLFEQERRLFARLSVFSGGCDLDAVEAVCADQELPGGELLDLLSRLIDKSLIASDVSESTARYSQLQTLREYARERLADSKEVSEVRSRHAAWYLQLAKSARQGLRGHAGIEWRDRLELELDNLRAALDWFIVCEDATSALTLVTGLAWFWFVRADSSEGVRWLGDALDLCGPDEEPSGLRGLAGVWRALHIANTVGSANAILDCREAIGDLRRGGAAALLGEGLLLQSEILNRTGDIDGAVASLTEARVLLTESNDQWGLAVRDLLAGANAAAKGRLDEAGRVARIGVDRCRELGDRWVMVEGLSLLASFEEAQGDNDAAITAYAELVEISHEVGNPYLETLGLMREAALHARLGDDMTAERLFARAVGSSRRSTHTKAALIGRATAAQRLGDPVACKRWLDEATEVPDTDSVGHTPASTTAFIGLTWWAPVPTR
jgi:predicted ATPase